MCSGFLICKMGMIILLTLEDFMSNADEDFSTGLSTERVLSNCSFLLLLSMEFKARFNDNL